MTNQVEEFVDGPLVELVKLYERLLKRGPDGGGFIYWAGEMAAGMTKEKVEKFIRNGHEFRKLTPSELLPEPYPGLKFGHRQNGDVGPWIIDNIDSNKVEYSGADGRRRVGPLDGFWDRFYEWPK
ncbi:MAG: DUF4214 domain-containing protein [Pseudomonadota bacterium]